MKINKHLIAISLLIPLMISACKGNQWFNDRTSQEVSESSEVTPSSSSESEPELPTYSVHFTAGGFKFDDGEINRGFIVQEGDPMPYPGEITIDAEFWYFAGWVDTYSGEYIDYGIRVYRNYDFVAQIERPDLQIFHVNDDNAQIYESESRIEITVPDKTVLNYDFNYIFDVSQNCEYELYYDASLTDQLIGKSLYYNDEVEFNLFVKLTNIETNNYRVYTLHLVRNYTVWIRYLDEDGSLIDKEEIQCAKQYVITKTIPGKIGKYFISWTLMPNSWDRIYDTPVDATHDVDLYASYDPIFFSIYFDADGGTYAPDVYNDNVAVIYGENYTLPVPTKDGFEFIGYFMNGEQITDNLGKSLEPWPIGTTETQIFYAIAHYQAI